MSRSPEPPPAAGPPLAAGSSPELASSPAVGRRHDTLVVSFATGAVEARFREVAVETAVAIAYGGVPFAVMMATPADLDDFAVGFSLTEGVIADPRDIRTIRTEAGTDGLTVSVDLVPGRLRDHLARRRNLSGRTGCGVCGIDDLAAVRRVARPRAGPGRPTSPGAVRRALDALDAGQALNARTGAVHAAAFAAPDGTLLCVREDVGRHNALDKTIGATLRAGLDPADGFVLVTSRCSFEMVEKSAAFGAGTLVAISAPTTLALERARDLGIALAGIARRDAMTVFCRPGRFGLPDPDPGDLPLPAPST